MLAVTNPTLSTPATVPANLTEPPDRILFHLIWEGVLLLVVLVLLGVALGTGYRLGNLFASAAGVAAVAFAFSLSIRAGVPNLAVAGAAGLAATFTGLLGGLGGGAVGLVVLLVVGALLAVAVAFVPVPAWASTLVVGLGLTAVSGLILGSRGILQIPGAFAYGSTVGTIVFVLSALVSIGVGAACLSWPIRRLIGGPRPAPATRTMKERGIMAAAIVISTVGAGLGGISQALFLGAADFNSTPNLLWALAAVLIGGASLHGRRSGVAGTTLGVLVVALVGAVGALLGLPSFANQLFVAVIAVVGLGVGALLDWLGTGRAPARTLGP
jgi:ribose/xylose/arabinose/galactoside ABC-type transport system permease subunit